MKHIRIISRDFRSGDYIGGRYEYVGRNRNSRGDKGVTRSEDGDHISKCGHYGLYSMKLSNKTERQRKMFAHLADYCGNIVKELNKCNESLGSLKDNDTAVVQANRTRSLGIMDRIKKHG